MPRYGGRDIRIEAPIKGLNYADDSTDIDVSYMSDCRNVGMYRGNIVPRYGYANYDGTGAGVSTLPLTGNNSNEILGVYGFLTNDGNNYLTALTDDNIYKFVQTTGWTSIRGAVAAFTGDSDNMWYADVVWKDTETDVWIVYTNGVDDIFYWTGGGANVADLAGLSYKADFLFNFEGYLVLLNTLEAGNRYPQRVRWSDRNDPTDWATGLSGFHTLPGSDEITGGVAFKENEAVIFRMNSLYRLRRIGTSLIFEPKPVEKAVGCPAGHAHAIIKGYLVYLGTDGDIYAYNGVSAESVGKAVKDVLITEINPKKVHKSFIIDKQEFDELWLHIPSGSSDTCDQLWIGNYKYFPNEPIRWTRGAFNDDMCSASTYVNQANLTIGELQGTIGSQDWRFGDRTLNELAPIIIYGDKDGYMHRYADIYGSDNGTAIDDWFDIKDLQLQQRTDKQWFETIETYYTGDTLDVYYSDDKGSNYTSIITLSDATDYKTTEHGMIRRASYCARLRWRNNTLNERWTFKEAVLNVQETGRPVSVAL
jgi:hypothetical protein